VVRHARSKISVLVGGMAGVLLLSSCLSATPTFDASNGGAPIRDGVLTYAAVDGLGAADTYQYINSSGTVTVSAPVTNQGGNRRELFWPVDAPSTTNQRSCATWDDSTMSVDQQGIALRIAPTADGLGTRAITVTKNILYGLYYFFNVHVWDTTVSATSPERMLAQVDMSAVLNGAPPPWHVCAQVVGAVFQFMVWTGNNPQPSWDDATAVVSVTLPDAWVYPGLPGWYVGHLHAGDIDTFTNLQTWSLSGSLDPLTVPSTSTSLPDTTTSVPDTTTSVPDTTTSVPDDTTTSVPDDTTTSVPDTTTSVPDFTPP
jgi:hypothetical protein